MNLSLSQSPPFFAPLRFFITAPVYGMLAGVVLALRAEPIVSSRFSLEALAAVHLLTLGVLAQSVAGALVQLLPVIAGVKLPLEKWLVRALHVGLNLGAVLLVAAFWLTRPQLFSLAAAALGLSVGLWVVAVGLALLRSPARGPTRGALSVGISGLAVTLGLGVTLALSLGGQVEIDVLSLVRLHAAWGVAGFGVCIVAGVAYVVVPMFQLTPPYSKRSARAVPLLVLTALALWSLATATATQWRWLDAGAAALLAAATAAFAVESLRLQARRRRKVRDVTVWAWRIGLWSLLAATVAATARYFGAPEVVATRLDYLSGAVVLCGAFPSFIAGMLYKIVPFLIWVHLSQRNQRAPLMHEVFNPGALRLQVLMHAAAVALLALGAAWVPLAAVGGAVFAASQALLLVNLVNGVQVYRAAETKKPGSPNANRASFETA